MAGLYTSRPRSEPSIYHREAHTYSTSHIDVNQADPEALPKNAIQTLEGEVL
jgi:hypothetical protein